MTAELSTEASVRRELWVSFGGLVRSYVAAATLGSPMPQAAVVETGSGALQVTGPRHTVRLELRPSTGDGYWVVTRAPGAQGGEPEILDEGAFRLLLDARMEWSGRPGPLEMDAAAEALAILALS